MKSTLAAILFRVLLYGRCPACHSWTKFSRPTSALSGYVPAELQGLVPQICKCRKHGCTSSVRAITGLELRSAR